MEPSAESARVASVSEARDESEVEPPYGTIARELRAGTVVPFLGAGASLVRPAANDTLAEAIVHALLPTAAELSEKLAEESSFPSRDDHDRCDLAKVASYFVETSARRTLRARLREVFDREYPIGDIHTYLAEIDRPLLIVTTNYDDLLERAFTAANRPYHVVVHASDRRDLAGMVLWWAPGSVSPTAVRPNELRLDMRSNTVIYKMHGTIDRQVQLVDATASTDDMIAPPMPHDNYVITEEDYVDFLARMTTQNAIPAAFMRHFYGRHFLFLGYSLRDWNLRVVLKNLKAVLPRDGVVPLEEEERIVSWAVQRDPSVLERRLWERRDVGIFDLSLNAFVARLRAV